MDNKYVTIIDNTGRNILGIVSEETDSTITLSNPVMISVQPQNGQFQVQLIPLFLAEFIKGGGPNNRNFAFTYSKSNVAVGTGFDIDVRITSQYARIIEAANAVKVDAKTDTKPEVVKLFED